MQKKFILVGLKNRSLGWDFFKAVLDSLERYSVDLTHIDHVRLRFETPNTKTWFVFEKDRSQWYDGIRADAIFGSQWKTLLDRATKDTFIAHEKGVGLVEYICKVEKEASESYKALEIGHALTTKLPGIKTVHFSGPVTAVIWEDKTKTIVRCNDGEEPDYEKGLAMAIAKKALGTNKSGSNYYDIFKQWLSKIDNKVGFGPEPKEDLDEKIETVPELVEEVTE